MIARRKLRFLVRSGHCSPTGDYGSDGNKRINGGLKHSVKMRLQMFCINLSKQCKSSDGDLELQSNPVPQF